MIAPIRIVLTDDHSVVRQGLRTLLEMHPQFTVVAEAASGEEAIEVCALLRPDLVILDLVMKGISGAAAAGLIKQENPACRTLILTSYQSSEYLAAAARSQVDSYLLKDIEPGELIAAVERTAKGQPVIHPAVAQQMMKALRNPGGAGSGMEPLTERELEVLDLIADGLTNTEIGDQLFISEKTVKTHVSHVLAKLGVADRTQAAVYAWRQGMKGSV